MLKIPQKIDDFFGKLANWLIYLLIAAALWYIIKDYEQGKYKFFIDYNEQHP
jgi:hypothetical protein